MGKLSNAAVIGTAGTSQVTTVTITGGPTGGTFTVTVNGQTTAGNAHNISAANLETALEALSSVDVDEAIVTRSGAGSAGDPYVYSIAFAKTLACVAVTVTASGAGLTGGSTPAANVATTTAAVARASGTADVSDSNLVAIQLAFDAGAVGSVTITGSLDPPATASGFDTLATAVTATASTTEVVHLVDKPVAALKVDASGLTSGSCTAKYAVFK